QAIPAFGAHGAARARLADGGGRFAVAEVAGEKAALNDGSALRGDAFVVVAEGAEAGAVLDAGVSDDVDDLRGIAQGAELVQGEKAHAGEIRFHAEDAVELDGMADGFVNLQAELAAFKNDGARALGTLRGLMQSDRFLGNRAGVADEVHGFDGLVALEGVLAAEAIRVGALLDFVVGKAGGDDAGAGLNFSRVNAGADARDEKLLDAAEGHGAFG